MSLVLSIFSLTLIIKNRVLRVALSDHPQILTLTTPNINKMHNIEYIRLFTKSNVDKFNLTLSEEQWLNVFESTTSNSKALAFHDIYMEHFNYNFPSNAIILHRVKLTHIFGKLIS